MDFHSQTLRGSYTGRRADRTWQEFTARHLQLEGATVMDLGCGGGIYSRALVALGGGQVVGIDSSEISLADARAQPHPRLTYLHGEAAALPVRDASFDIVLARALVHHLSSPQLGQFAAEALRCLKPGGTLVIQDRTLEDALAPGSPSNTRGYLFGLFPELRGPEAERRHSAGRLDEVLGRSGFSAICVMPLIEPRKTYADVDELLEDIRARRGRSILHRLTDEQLERYVQLLGERFADRTHIRELEPWTVWLAR